MICSQRVRITIFALFLAAILAPANYLHRKDCNEEISPTSGKSKASGNVTMGGLEMLIQQNDLFLILDAQADWFYEQEHIPGALNLPNDEMDKYSPLLKDKIARAKCVVVYCADRDCANSKILATALHKLGHVNISVYPGGLKEWKATGKGTKAK